jgi:salicylate hydroxylase
MGFRDAPRFAGRAAWRALLPAAEAAPEFREPVTHLWLGRDAHIGHYPVKNGAVINIVLIMNDGWNARSWSEPVSRDALLPRLAAAHFAPQLLGLLDKPQTWLKWALYDRRPLLSSSHGPVALIGDAAHPMLPYLAQGAAMGIEDAMVAALCLARLPEDAAGPGGCSAWRRATAASITSAALVQRCATRPCASWAARTYCSTTIGSMIGARPQPCRSPDAVSNHHRR